MALLLADDRRDEAMALLKHMAQSDSSPEAEEKVGAGALTVWVSQHMPMRAVESQFPRSNWPDGIPTARVTQVRDFNALIEMLDKIGKAYGRPFPRRLVPPFFDNIHSQAEIYTLAEIERVFGPLEQMDGSTVMQLTSLMQKNLQKPWQSGQIQSANGTNRDDQQRMQAVVNGYHTLTTLLEQRLATTPDWQLLIALANARFQAAEIGLKIGNGFAAYTTGRDRAFDAMHRAAAEYAKTVSSEDNGMESLEPYTDWFAMAMGTSDMATLKVTDVRSVGEMDRLRDAIHALPGDAAQRHIERFATLLDDQIPTAAPDVKERITRNGLIVLGNTPLATPLLVMMQSYADLLTELKLNVAVDGPEKVGDKEPFGLMVSIDHTDNMEAESKGFAKYILTPDQGSPLTDGRRNGVNYRVNFEKHLRDALDKSFDIQSIVWAPEDVKSRPIDRPGWSKTSLAYVVAKAKDASVDRVPPVQIDIDFNDRMNMVILPVTSGILVIDSSHADARPVSQMTVDQRINDRDLGKGMLKLELRASGRGLIPNLDQLVSLSSLNKFTIAGIVDSGVKVDRFDTNPADPTLSPDVLSAREWTITLHTKGPVDGDVTFNFPTLAGEYSQRQDVTSTFHRYDDADVVEAGRSVRFQLAKAPSHHSLWTMLMIPLLAIAACAGIAVMIVRTRFRRKVEIKIESTAEFPEGSFSKIRLLNSLKTMRTGSSAEQMEQEIRDLELQFFSPVNDRPVNSLDVGQLDRIVKRWK